ncbi:SwmB domain-containing protein [Brevibacillus choshinensis]|uniref:SwmB domain-containing protein n=1 Tax=Brevibacillus choshinensis TaxID=54911 RepID=UPI002E20884D|nr:SwmB domain-containing protein [Brevibacillus choshinensis]
MKAYIAAGNTPSDMAAPTKVGTYKLIVVDEAGNVSTLADSDTITVEDTTKPSYVAAGTVYFNIIDMTFDEELDGNHADPTAFVVHVGAGTIPVQRVEVEGTQLKIYLVSNIPWATAISIDYTASGSNDLVDPYGNKVSNFAGKPIGNNVE